MRATDETLPIDSPMTVEGSIVGTVCYMSPEQAQARPVDPRSDIFSFGLVLYEILTGQKAFSGDSALATLSAILRDEATPIGQVVKGVPPELEQIVHRAMRKQPDQRWQNMQEMRAALLLLKQKADSGVLRTMLGGTAAAAPPKRRAGMLPVWLAAATAALAAAGGGWWWMKHRPAQHSLPPVAVQAAPAPVAPPPAPVPEASAPPAQPVDAVVTNRNILDMVQAKVPAGVIASHIKSSKTNFDLSTNGIIQLTTGGVPGSIIEVMRNPQADTAASRPAQRATPSAAPPASTSVHTVSIQDGLPFNIALTEDVPVKLTAGQLLHFTVTKDMKVGDVVAIAKGTALNGTVVDPGEGKKLLIVKNKATFRLASVESTGGTKLAIRATPGHRTGDKAGRQIELPGARNKDMLAPAGAGYLGYIDSDQVVTVKH
jgi:serine/threonine-protein kinase